MLTEELASSAMQLIAYGGDAASHFYAAIDCARNGDFEAAEAEQKAGREGIVEAHHVQLDLLSKEAQGDDLELSLLLVHSQDHLMSAMLLENLTREFVQLYREREQDRAERGA